MSIFLHFTLWPRKTHNQMFPEVTTHQLCCCCFLWQVDVFIGWITWPTHWGFIYLFIFLNNCFTTSKNKVLHRETQLWRANILDCSIIKSEFKFLSYFHIYIRSNTLGKKYEFCILPAMGKIESPQLSYLEGFGIKETIKLNMLLNKRYKPKPLFNNTIYPLFEWEKSCTHAFFESKVKCTNAFCTFWTWIAKVTSDDKSHPFTLASPV